MHFFVTHVTFSYVPCQLAVMHFFVTHITFSLSYYTGSVLSLARFVNFKLYGHGDNNVQRANECFAINKRGLKLFGHPALVMAVVRTADGGDLVSGGS
jgi:hypothetical protein